MQVNRPIRKVAVLGAGVMGAQIAAHCVNVGVPVILFDLAAPLTKDGKPQHNNTIALRAIDNLKKLSPAPLAVSTNADLIQAANYDDDLAQLAGCDLVIEAIAERVPVTIFLPALPEEAAQAFLTEVPQCEFVDVSGAGHMVAGDRNDAFTSAVVGFLGRIAA